MVNELMTAFSKSKAISRVVIHHSHSLHVSITNSFSNKPETSFMLCFCHEL